MCTCVCARHVCAVDAPVCVAYHAFLRGDVRPPLQQQGDGRHMAIAGRMVEGCRPKLQQQRESGRWDGMRRDRPAATLTEPTAARALYKE